MSKRPIRCSPLIAPLLCGLNVLLWHCARQSSASATDPRPVAGFIEQLTSLVAPPLCAACGATRPPESVLCDRCEADLAAAPRVIDPGPPDVDIAVSASPFDGVAREIVHGLKYAHRLALAGVAGKAMLRALPSHEQVGAVVAVPAGPWRWRWRGFDPAEEIAISFAAQAGLPFSCCLRRRGGRRQVGRRRSERLADPPAVRAAPGCPRVALLVDDVWTTGATLSACGRALRESGCRRVVALTLARAL
jgi:predicted amidophosphoribosyltransferase